MIATFDDEFNFPHKLLLTNRKDIYFASYLSADIKLSKTHLSDIVQSGGFLVRPLGPLLKPGLPLIRNVLQSLAKSVLIPLGLTATASVVDAGIYKKILGSGTTTLIMSNEEMEDIMENVSWRFWFIIKKSETIQNDAKEQKVEFLSILLGTLGAN